MYQGTSFGRAIDLLKRTMDVAVLRRDVIADNISNADVPNFKRSEISFESFLKRALDSEKIKPSLELATTNEKHIPLWRPTDWKDVSPRRVLDYLTTAKNNGNNVDPEQELMDLLNNQLSYTLMAQAINHEFQQVNLVLR